jgi:hypothetical protein
MRFHHQPFQYFFLHVVCLNDDDDYDDHENDDDDEIKTHLNLVNLCNSTAPILINYFSSLVV